MHLDYFYSVSQSLAQSQIIRALNVTERIYFKQVASILGASQKLDANGTRLFKTGNEVCYGFLLSPYIDLHYIVHFHETAAAFSTYYIVIFNYHQLKAMRQRVLNISTGSRVLDNILGGSIYPFIDLSCILTTTLSFYTMMT